MYKMRLSVAPMMDWTDRHERYFLRQFSRHLWLYTEMIAAAAVVHGDRDRLLEMNPAEHPVSLQLGGCEPELLATATKIGAEYGYDEINLNLGCPSDRVQAGRFGACLMKEPELVGDCIGAMRGSTDLPITAKIRLGVDECDSDLELHAFVGMLEEAGVERVVVHARKAWLQGLSPKQNREVPPLQYDRVYSLKRAFPQLAIELNGGLANLDAAATALAQVDGCMLGRAAYHHPGILLHTDSRLFGESNPATSEHQIVERLVPYVETELARGTPLHAMTRHWLGLFQGQPGARAFRRHLSTEGPKRKFDLQVLLEAVSCLQHCPMDVQRAGAGSPG